MFGLARQERQLAARITEVVKDVSRVDDRSSGDFSFKAGDQLLLRMKLVLAKRAFSEGAKTPRIEPIGFALLAKVEVNGPAPEVNRAPIPVLEVLNFTWK